MPERNPSDKLTHYAVDYMAWNGMPGQTCAGCANLIEAQEPRCKSVASPISLNGWCMRWEKKTPVEEACLT